jgi:hypothetical protein
MTLIFSPCAVAAPFQALDAQLGMQTIALALNGPWVLQNDNPRDPRHTEAGSAIEAAWDTYYNLLRAGELVSYVREPGSNFFLRVPPEYYLSDEWGIGRCFHLSSFKNKGVPELLENADIFVVQADVEDWTKRQQKPAAKRGPKPRFDAKAFISAGADELLRQGGYVVGGRRRSPRRRG